VFVARHCNGTTSPQSVARAAAHVFGFHVEGAFCDKHATAKTGVNSTCFDSTCTL
jgi:hypothetical protein